MTTTFFDYTPSTSSVFQFSPTLDGQEYIAQIPWALFGQRPYINIFALNGTLIVSKALVGSPIGVNIESIAWSRGVVTVQTEVPHNYSLGATIDLTIVGCTPDAYNGVQQCLITGPQTFTYALENNPGNFVAVGVVNYDINLVAGYFTSSLVFRVANGQFEVSP